MNRWPVFLHSAEGRSLHCFLASGESYWHSSTSFPSYKKKANSLCQQKTWRWSLNVCSRFVWALTKQSRPCVTGVYFTMMFDETSVGVQNTPRAAVETHIVLCFNILTKPSAPIRPRPDTLNVTSASQCSKLTLFLVHTVPLWLLRDGVIRTWSALGMASGLGEERGGAGFVYVWWKLMSTVALQDMSQCSSVSKEKHCYQPDSVIRPHPLTFWLAQLLKLHNIPPQVCLDRNE